MIRRTIVTLAWFPALAAMTVGCSRSEEAVSGGAEPEAAEHAASEAAPLPPVPEGAAVVFVSPESGATVTGPEKDGKVDVHVTMGVEGMRVMPAGEVVAGAGHHHVIIDAPPIPAGQTVPADATHIHFGGGQTEADIPLTPGEHTLTLQFADGLHRSYGPALSTTITVDAEPAAAAEGEEGEAEGEEGHAEGAHEAAEHAHHATE